MVNWCAALGTVLANDEVVNGVSERGGYPVEQKVMRQWCLRVSAYAQRLLDGLDTIDWTDSLKETQRNWIGRSEGTEVQFKVKDSDLEFTIFTTRADTMFGVTFMVLAPESELVTQVTTAEQKAEVEAYLDRTKKRTERERIADRSVTGVFSGSYAINPFTGDAVPIWISDYVLAGYGTGAIMAVPAHDSRDYAFAKHFNLPIVPLIEGCDVSEESFDAKEGIVCNSPKAGVTPYCGLSLNGLTVKEAIAATKKYVQENQLGRVKVNFRLRDAIFSRQRYWGEPIPVVHCEKCGVVAADEKDLPLTLPEVESYKPTGTGESPLASIDSWVNTTCPVCGGKAHRETNTMPQWAGSCWYYLRYIDPNNSEALADKKKLDYWGDVDLYVGGAEHAVLHLLYARFWHKVLYDLGVVPTKEPFMALRNQGMILGENGEKMSKSRGNVINPDDVIREHGADTLRMYEMFMGPLAADKPWSTKNIFGVRRFLEKTWRLMEKDIREDVEISAELEKLLHKTIGIVTDKLNNLEFNTAISQLMILLTAMQKEEVLNKSVLQTFVKLLHPFAPFITDEMWEMLGGKECLLRESWPEFDKDKIVDETVTVIFQVNGKLRDKAQLPVGLSNEEMIAEAKKSSKVAGQLEGKTIVKEIAIKDKLVNIVVK
jgi:leucyl-tRNA synthetase